MKQGEGVRLIPSVERILTGAEAGALIQSFGREAVKTELVRWLDDFRRHPGSSFSLQSVLLRVEAELAQSMTLPLRRVINGTGVLIHTNLGRAPIDGELWQRAGELATRYSNLELDLKTGERGARDDHLSGLCRRLFGCEAAVITNNNASAVLLTLAAIAAGKNVIVSRGELVEIGGSFRIPEVIEQGGARLREVGTTNRTKKADYLEAAGKKSAAILRVNRSNFDIVGFTEQPAIEDLVEIGRRKKIPVIVDEGSGRIVDLARYGFARKETVAELFTAGVDVVTCSTDKLIGATQGGLILGSAKLVQRCLRHPLMRALRAGKETYAIVGETLRAFASGSHEEQVVLYRLLAAPVQQLRQRAAAIAGDATHLRVVDSRSALGGGTTPTESIPSVALHVDGKPNDIHRRLREAAVPIIGIIQERRYLLDLRTILPDDDALVANTLRSLSPRG